VLDLEAVDNSLRARGVPIFEQVGEATKDCSTAIHEGGEQLCNTSRFGNRLFLLLTLVVILVASEPVGCAEEEHCPEEPEADDLSRKLAQIHLIDGPNQHYE